MPTEREAMDAIVDKNWPAPTTTGDGDCMTRIRSTPPWCAHNQTWEVLVYSPGLEAWQSARVCDPCMDDLRTRGFSIRDERQIATATWDGQHGDKCPVANCDGVKGHSGSHFAWVCD